MSRKVISGGGRLSINWRPGRYGKRIRPMKRARHKPRPVLDGFLLVLNTVFIASLALYLAIAGFNVARIPVYAAYGVVLPLFACGSLFLSPRGRPAAVQAALFILLWVAGSAFLFATRNEMNPSTHNHGRPPASTSRPKDAGTPLAVPSGRPGLEKE